MMGKKMDTKRAFHESHLKNMGPKISKNLNIFYELWRAGNSKRRNNRNATWLKHVHDFLGQEIYSRLSITDAQKVYNKGYTVNDFAIWKWKTQN